MKIRTLNLISKMKPLNEKLILKDATINKVQFDTECFINWKIWRLSKEDLSEVDYIFYLHNRWSARVCKM
jgi:hypothetical protein